MISLTEFYLSDKSKQIQMIIDSNTEIERLKRMKLHTEKYASEMEDKYILEKSKNDKAIEYIENIQTPTYMLLEDICDLLDILKGVDKE